MLHFIEAAFNSARYEDDENGLYLWINWEKYKRNTYEPTFPNNVLNECERAFRKSRLYSGFLGYFYNDFNHYIQERKRELVSLFTNGKF